MIGDFNDSNMATEKTPPLQLLDNDHHPQRIIVDGESHDIAHINQVLRTVDATIPHLNSQFKRHHNNMLISDTPNEEADDVRLRHFAMNAYVNGLVAQPQPFEQFIDPIIGLIARVQLEIIMFRNKYGRDSQALPQIKIILACIVFYKRLKESKIAPIDESEGIWPNTRDDCFELACKISAAKYPDMNDRRASALFFSQLLQNKTITTNPFKTGNVDMYAFVTTGNTIRMIWEALTGLPVKEMIDQSGNPYVISQEDISDLEALQVLSHKGAKALRSRNGETYHNLKFNKVYEWKLSDPDSEYVEVKTNTTYVVLMYLYLSLAIGLSVVAGVLNWTKRNTVLERIFDALGIFTATMSICYIATRVLSRTPYSFSSFLTGRRRLGGLESLGQYHGKSTKSLLLLMADAAKLNFPGDLNACYVNGPKTGTVDLPLIITERDLYRSIIVGDSYAYDNQGAWRFTETKLGVLHIGAVVPDGKPLLAIRRKQNRYVGGSSN